MTKISKIAVIVSVAAAVALFAMTYSVKVSQKMKKLKVKTTDLDRNLQTSTNVTKNLRGKVSDLEDQISAYKERIINYQFEMETARELAPEQAAGPVNSEEIEKLSAQLVEAKRIEKQLRVDRKRLREEVDNLQKEMAETKREAELNTARLSDMEERFRPVKDYEDRIKIKEEEIEDAEMKALQFKKEVIRLETELAQAHLRLKNSGERRITDLANEQKRMANKLEKEKSKFERSISEKESNLSLLKDEKVELQTDLEQTKRHVKSAVKELSKTNKQKQKVLKEAADVHYNLGVLLTEKGEYEKAVQTYEKALELVPTDADTHYNLAILYDEYFDESAKALKHYRAFLRINPTAVEANQVQKWIIDKSSEVKVRE